MTGFFRRIINWGLPLFGLAMALGICALWLAVRFPLQSNPGLHGETIPVMLLAGALALPLLAHFSYGRVHSARLFFLLYLMGGQLALVYLSGTVRFGPLLAGEMFPFHFLDSSTLFFVKFFMPRRCQSMPVRSQLLHISAIRRHYSRSHALPQFFCWVDMTRC